MWIGDAVSVVELYAKECTCVVIPTLSSIASLDPLVLVYSPLRIDSDCCVRYVSFGIELIILDGVGFFLYQGTRIDS
jgi:hypothetical protein